MLRADVVGEHSGEALWAMHWQVLIARQEHSDCFQGTKEQRKQLREWWKETESERQPGSKRL